MPVFSKNSTEKLLTCHEDLQTVCRELIKQYDFSVLCGHRGQIEQDQAVAAGTSKVNWPNSAHNKQPSCAVDIAPYPINWQDIGRFKEMWIRFDTVAFMLRAQGRIHSDFVWGGNWKTLQDYPHIEIKGV